MAKDFELHPLCKMGFWITFGIWAYIQAVESFVGWIWQRGIQNPVKCLRWSMLGRNSVLFKSFEKQCPHYLNKVFVKTPESGLSVRNSYHKLKQPFHKLNATQSGLSFIGPALGNEISGKIQRTTSLNTLKHNLKKRNLNEI